MLTTKRMSRLRLSSAAVTLLTLGGLATTASGAQLAFVPAEVSAPPAPLNPALPGPPDKEGVSTTIWPDGRVTRTKYVRVVRNGKSREVITDAVADIPDISAQTCPGDGDRHPLVLNEKNKDGKSVLIICSNRIEPVTQQGAALAANSKDIELDAYRSALAGLRTAQQRMLTDTKVGEKGREEAIKVIDKSIKAIEDDLARVN